MEEMKDKKEYKSYRKQGEGGESDFQSCHIIIVTCTVFNNNRNTQSMQHKHKACK